MKICILADSHDHGSLLGAAVGDAHARGAEAVLHCGDVVAPSTLKVLRAYPLPVHIIHGNNTGDLVAMLKFAHRSGGLIHYYGQDAFLTLHSRKIFMVHYPLYGRALALTGDYDLVCCGHEHQTWMEKITNIQGGHTWCVNPGTVGGVSAPATYLLGDLDKMDFQVLNVPLN